MMKISLDIQYDSANSDPTATLDLSTSRDDWVRVGFSDDDRTVTVRVSDLLEAMILLSRRGEQA